jgi:hypothetical protein
MSASLTALSLSEIASRINLHLQKMSGDPEGGFGYFGAYARAQGAYVRVVYVTYQGGTSLTREEALHYLAGLDGGWRGRHYEYFRENPLVVVEPDILYHALVRVDHGFTLYGVTKRTEKRLYGRKVEGRWLGEWVDRDRVLRMNADMSHFLAAVQAKAEHDARVQASTTLYNEQLRTIAEGDND